MVISSPVQTCGFVKFRDQVIIVLFIFTLACIQGTWHCLFLLREIDIIGALSDFTKLLLLLLAVDFLGRSFSEAFPTCVMITSTELYLIMWWP